MKVLVLNEFYELGGLMGMIERSQCACIRFRPIGIRTNMCTRTKKSPETTIWEISPKSTLNIAASVINNRSSQNESEAISPLKHLNDKVFNATTMLLGRIWGYEILLQLHSRPSSTLKSHTSHHRSKQKVCSPVARSR